MICEEDLHTFVEQHCKDRALFYYLQIKLELFSIYFHFALMTVKDRILKFLEIKGITQKAFEQRCGLSNGYVNNIRVSISDKVLQKIVLSFPELNPVWLRMGEGEILTSGQDAVRPYKAYKYLEAHNLIQEPEEFYQKTGINEREFKLLEDGTHPDPVGAALKIAKAFPEVEFLFTSKPGEHNKKGKSKVIPYYDIEVSAGPISFYQDYPELPHTCMELPFVSDVDLAMPVYGDSMYPKIKNGDIVLLKKITDHNVIMYGEVYLVITNDYRTLKYVRKHPEEDKVLLVSENDRFDPVAIKKDAILHMFLYKGKFEKSQI